MKFIKIGWSILKITSFYSLVILLLYFPLFDPNPHFQKFISNDFLHQTYPWISSFLKNIHLKNFDLTLWNELASSGTPGWFEYKIFYLPLYLLKIPFELNNDFLDVKILEYFILFHLAFGATGIHLYLKYKYTSNSILLFTGSLFFICTGLAINIIWLGYITALSLTPWIIICFDKYLSKKGLFWIIIGSFLAFQQFAACAQFFLYTMLFLLLYLVIFYKLTKRMIKALLKFYTSTALFSSIYIFPLLEYSKNAVRFNYITDVYNSTGHAGRSIIQLLYFMPDNVYYQFLYIGIVPMTIIISNLTSKNSKIFKIVAGGIIVYLFSTNLGIFNLIIRFIPAINSMRWHSRANEFVIILLIIALIISLKNYSVRLVKETKITIILIILIVLNFFIDHQLPSSIEQLYFAILLSVIYLFSIHAYGKKLINKNKLILIICLICIFDLTRTLFIIRANWLKGNSFSANFIQEKNWFEERENFKHASNYRISPDNYLKEDYNIFLINGDFSAGSFGAAGGEYTPATTKYYDAYLKTASTYNKNLYAIANISTTNNIPLPRAFTLNCYTSFNSDQETLQAMENTSFLGDKSVYLDKPLKNLNVKRVTTEEISQCENYLPVVSNQSNDQITFDPIIREHDSILFVSDNWYPGWNVYVNGHKKELLRANYSFKAVGLKKGVNNVIFKYEPTSIKKGSYLTFGYIIFSIIFIAFHGRKNAKRS